MLKRRRRLQKAAVQRGACRASGMGREGCRGRRGNYLSLARFLLPASFQASVPQQLSEEKTNKSEKETGRRRRRAATREHLSSRPIFRNTLCANYTIKSLRQRCEGKKAPAAKTEKKTKKKVVGAFVVHHRGQLLFLLLLLLLFLFLMDWFLTEQD